MKSPKTICNFNHINPNLAESKKNELKALYKFYHKTLALQNDFHTFQKTELASNTGPVGLVVTETIAGGLTVNPGN